jgi:hypothetical protein
MKLTQINTHLMDLASKGFVLDVDARNLEITENLSGGQASGSISDSRIQKKNDPLFRLNNMEFTNVEWGLPAILDNVAGLKLLPHDGDPCRAIFRNNSFTVIGALSNNASGHLIAGDQVAITPDNSGELVFLCFQGCQFDPRMGSPAFPKTNIANPITRGTWTFDAADLHGFKAALNVPLDSKGKPAAKEAFVFVF